MRFVEHIHFYDNVSTFPSHNHMSCELIFVTEGSVTLNANGINYKVSKGELCLIPSGVTHYTETSNQRYKRWLMFVNPWEFNRLYFSPEIQGMLTGLLYKYPLTAYIPFGEKIMETIHDEYNLQKPFYDDVILSMVINFFAYIARNNVSKEWLNTSDTVKTIMQVQFYIQQNCASPLKISEVAKRFFVSNFHLTHIFKKHTGMSLKGFLISCRLSKAEQMIRNTKLSVTEIAQSCGFTSASYLTVRFKKQYGCTPSRYRGE